MTLPGTSSPLLQFQSANPQPYPVQERFSIYQDGGLVLVCTAAAKPEQRFRAGTFAALASPPLLKQAEMLAQALLQVPAESSQSARGAIQYSVSANLNEASCTHDLGVSSPERLPAPLQDALRLAETFRQLVDANPYAVIELSARFRNIAGQPAIVFTFTNPGSQRVTFNLQEKGFSLLRRAADSVQLAWQNTSALPQGLVDPEFNLVDGLRAPARLKPGQRASLSIPTGTLEITSGDPFIASVQGTLALAEPGSSVPGMPRTPFWLDCDLT